MLIETVSIDPAIEFGAPTIVVYPNIFAGSPIETQEAFGSSILKIIPVINLQGFGIPSGEDFRRIMLVFSIPSELVFGDIKTKFVISIPSIGTLNVFGVAAIKHIIAPPILSVEKFGYPEILKKNDRPGVNAVIESQFPTFVREDHSRFLNFMKAYYDWMENAGGALHKSRRLLSYQDIDTTVDEFADHLFKEFLPNIPRAALADKAILLKYIKQFYRAKGTEKSYKFFFRILYNANVEFYYPRVDILQASDGKWIQNRTIRIVAVSGDVTKLVSQKIRGKIKNCTAFVERVVGVEAGALSGYEVFLNRSSITGVFLPNETIESEDGTIQAKISPVPVSLDLAVPGTDYSVGDIFEIVGGGVGAKAKVTAVKQNGAIDKLTIISYGLAYNTDIQPTIDLSTPIETEPNPFKPIAQNPTRVVASATVTLGALTNYPGYYLNEDGQLSTSKYLHDGEFYQQFSYVTYVQESLSEYKLLLRRLVHPIGLKHFGGVRIQNLLGALLKNPRQHFPTKIIIHTKPNLSTLKLHTKAILRHNGVKNPQVFGLGPTNYSIYQNRFAYKPFEKYDANREMSGVNFGYWGNYYDLSTAQATTPIKIFGNMTPSEIEKHSPWKAINMVADSFVRVQPLVQTVSIEADGFFGNCEILTS